MDVSLCISISCISTFFQLFIVSALMCTLKRGSRVQQPVNIVTEISFRSTWGSHDPPPPSPVFIPAHPFHASVPLAFMTSIAVVPQHFFPILITPFDKYHVPGTGDSNNAAIRIIMYVDYECKIDNLPREDGIIYTRVPT